MYSHGILPRLPAPPLALLALALLLPVLTVQFDASNAGVMVSMPVLVAGPALPPAPPVSCNGGKVKGATMGYPLCVKTANTTMPISAIIIRPDCPPPLAAAGMAALLPCWYRPPFVASNFL